MGRGLFALASIPSAAVLGQFYTIRIPPAEVARMAGGEISRFWFEDDGDGSAHVVLGPIELVNHSREPNCDRSWALSPAGEVVTLFAVRDIAPGEQLTIDYKFSGGPDDPPWA